MNKQKTIEVLRGIGIAIEGLMDELRESDAPKPFQAAPSRPFERGDRVRCVSSDDEGDCVGISTLDLQFPIDVQRNDGSIFRLSERYCTLVTPASEREIKVGDTFSCSYGSEYHEAGQEFTALDIRGGIILDTNQGEHDKRWCIFRSRPHKSEPQKFADDPAIQAAINAGNNQEKAEKYDALLSRIEELEKRLLVWESDHVSF